MSTLQYAICGLLVSGPKSFRKIRLTLQKRLAWKAGPHATSNQLKRCQQAGLIASETFDEGDKLYKLTKLGFERLQAMIKFNAAVEENWIARFRRPIQHNSPRRLAISRNLPKSSGRHRTRNSHKSSLRRTRPCADCCSSVGSRESGRPTYSMRKSSEPTPNGPRCCLRKIAQRPRNRTVHDSYQRRRPKGTPRGDWRSEERLRFSHNPLSAVDTQRALGDLQKDESTSGHFTRRCSFREGRKRIEADGSEGR